MITNAVCNYTDDFEFAGFNIEIKDGTKIDMNDWFFDVWGTPNNLNLVKPVKQHNRFYVALQDKAKELGLNLFEHDKHYVVSSKTCEQWKYDLMSDEEKADYDFKKKVNGLKQERMSNKSVLDSTDWVVAKMNEMSITGEYSVEELRVKYATELAQRTNARARINAIESELKELGIEDFNISYEGV